MWPIEVIKRWLGAGPYQPKVHRALRRAKTRFGERSGKLNGAHGVSAPPGLTQEEKRALDEMRQQQSEIRARAREIRHGQ